MRWLLEVVRRAAANYDAAMCEFANATNDDPDDPWPDVPKSLPRRPLNLPTEPPF